MREIPVTIKNAETAVLFVELNKDQPFDIDIKAGRYIVDGKSVLGVLGCAVEKNFTAVLLTDNEEDVETYLGKLEKLLSN